MINFKKWCRVEKIKWISVCYSAEEFYNNINQRNKNKWYYFLIKFRVGWVTKLRKCLVRSLVT
jgi:hypothetical protein